MYCFHLEATGTLQPYHFLSNLRIETIFCADDPLSLIDKIHKRNMRAGVAISPDTPSTAISDEVANAADMLLVMTVYPGIYSLKIDLYYTVKSNLTRGN